MVAKLVTWRISKIFHQKTHCYRLFAGMSTSPFSKLFNSLFSKEALYLTSLFFGREHQGTDREAYTERISSNIQVASLAANAILVLYEYVRFWPWQTFP